MNSETNFISWWVKEIQWKNGSFFSMYLKIDDLASCETSDKWYIKLTMSKRKQPDQYWNTHFITENTWQPWDRKWNEQKSTQNNNDTEISVEDIPF